MMGLTISITLGIPHLPVGQAEPLAGPDQALCSCLQITGNLMQLEMATHMNLAEFFGAGYEIATSIDGRYQKVDEITYLFWRAKVEGGRLRIAFAPHKAFRYSYEKDLLVIRALSFEDSKSIPVVTDQRQFYVEPVYRDADPGEIAAIEAPTLNSRYLCVYFLLETDDGLAVLTAVSCIPSASDTRWVTFTETAAGISGFNVDETFVRRVADAVLADPKTKR